MAKSGNGKTVVKSTTGKVDVKPTASATPPKGHIEAQMPDAETLKKLAPHIAKVRSHVRESFGSIVMSMMLLPRYRNQTLADLQHLVLDPLVRDRVAIAYPGKSEDNQLTDTAIWAWVAEEALVRFPAFNQRTTPEVFGQVARVSPTSVVDEKSGFTFYRVGIEIPDTEFKRLGNKVLVPGMPVETVIPTSERTVLEYLLKPLADNLTHVFREE